MDRHRPVDHPGRDLARRYPGECQLERPGHLRPGGGLTRAGLIQDLAIFIRSLAGDSPFWAYTTIVWASVLFSAFVDNVPYLTAMLPVSALLSQGLGIPPQLMGFGSLIGSCLGGNITPIGASANIVAVGCCAARDITSVSENSSRSGSRSPSRRPLGATCSSGGYGIKTS